MHDFKKRMLDKKVIYLQNDFSFGRNLGNPLPRLLLLPPPACLFDLDLEISFFRRLQFI